MRHPLSIAGMVLTTTSAIVFLVVFLADLFGLHTNPYLGILFFLVLPAIFVFGLLLIPLGAWFARRRSAAGGTSSELRWPHLDLNIPQQRTTAAIIAGLTLANLVIVSLATYKGVEHMDSVAFCGQTCHTAMKPEAIAHQDGAHARVACVHCHIGSGATSYAKSKVSGTRQLLAVAFNTFARPIPTPVANLRPARDTCEQCHWPATFHGMKVRTFIEYAEDEANTPSTTTMQLHVGGGAARAGAAPTIHWHADAANEVDYISTDDQRQVIPYVRVKDRSGAVREYTADGVSPDQWADGERRRMDCMDCHNRPSHQMAASAERAVNAAMANGVVPVGLPFVRREAVRLLKTTYASDELAADAIATGLRNFYRAAYAPMASARQQEVEQAVLGTQQVFRRNVFPENNVRFGTYPDNAGHTDFPGCFRCHDDNHKAKDGTTISQSCDTCHTIE